MESIAAPLPVHAVVPEAVRDAYAQWIKDVTEAGRDANVALSERVDSDRRMLWWLWHLHLAQRAPRPLGDKDGDDTQDTLDLALVQATARSLSQHTSAHIKTYFA